MRTALNKLFVFFCTGLWHGASLNFIVWGLINGGFLMLESYNILNTKKWPRFFRHFYAVLATILAFVFFRADDLGAACRFIGRMFDLSSFTSTGYSMFMAQLTPMYLTMLALAIVFSTPVIKVLRERLTAPRAAAAGESCAYVVSLLLLAVCIITLSSASYNPFIYFRF